MSLLTLTLATIAICNALSLDIVSTSTQKNLNVPNGTIFKLTPYFLQEGLSDKLLCKKVVVASTWPEDVYCINYYTGIIWKKHYFGDKRGGRFWWFQNNPDTRKWKDIANIRYVSGTIVNKQAMYGVSHGGWTYKIIKPEINGS